MSEAFNRLIRWRDFGDNPDPGYCAGSKEFGDDVQAVLAELAALREPAGDEAAAAVYGAIRGMINPFGKTWGELTEDEKQESRQIANAVAPKIRAAERERCAKVLERKARGYGGYGTKIMLESAAKVMLEAAGTIRAGADDA